MSDLVHAGRPGITIWTSLSLSIYQVARCQIAQYDDDLRHCVAEDSVLIRDFEPYVSGGTDIYIIFAYLSIPECMIPPDLYPKALKRRSLVTILFLLPSQVSLMSLLLYLLLLRQPLQRALGNLFPFLILLR